MYLSLFDPSFFGEIPPHLSNLSRLIHLDLHYNRDLYPQNLDWVSSLSSLKYLDMRRLNLSGVGENWLTAINMLPALLEKLEHLDLHGNEKITGQLPSCFGNLCKLKTLDLSGNNFSGNIDGFLGNLSTCLNNNLESLAFHSNKLIGKIPDSLGIFGSLRQLSLGYNFFGGSIPASIGKLSSLQLLHLSYKEMNGTIPKSIGQLSELVTLLLDNNS
ncbi:receptor-like protein 12 [Quercus suber]|uniref:Receptor-like protein 12 n=1 Tax=Quercus suber TaxID=58331 RepID=A0AAW0IH45_QUESU